MTRSAPKSLWLPVLAIAAAGLALRLAAARGGLWLDEAWSAAFAADVGTPLGVFLNIHHDNNHHLNTLWLQSVGIDAPSIVQRGLSIVSGTIAIIVAALIVAPRGHAAAIIAATLFAVSPILVTYGSEARGYAPMVLALLIVILIVDRWLAAPRERPLAVALAIVCLLGTLAQLTFVFGLCAVVGWILLRRWREEGLRTAMIDTVRIAGLPIAVTLGTIGAVIRWLPGPDGFKVGSYFAFTFRDLYVGQVEMLSYTLGLPIGVGWLLPVLGLALIIAAMRPALGSRRQFYLLAMIGVPLGCSILQLGNVAIARYFLAGSIAILLMLAETAAIALARPGRWRGGAIVTLVAFLVGATWHDVRLLGDRRADPSTAIALMRSRAPDGATVSLDRARAAPVIDVAAAQGGYRARIAPCGRFLFVDRDGTETFPAMPVRCGIRYRPIGHAAPDGLSGSHWTLYERRP